MACTVTYSNTNNKVESVINQHTNTPSKLFAAINESALVLDKDSAYEIYKAVISKGNFEETIQNETPELVYTVKDKESNAILKQHKTLKELVADTGMNENVNVHLLLVQPSTRKEEILFSIDLKAIDKVSQYTKTDVNTFLLSSMKDGIISDIRQERNGKYYIVPGGEMSSTKLLNKQIFKERIRTGIGSSRIKIVNEGLFETIDSSKNQTDKNVELILDDLTNNTRKFNKAYKEDNVQPSKDAAYTEDELLMKLMDFLSELGIRVTSISNYVDSYTIRNGVAPNALALADIANRVIAFKDGRISVQDLSEEVAHFIIEAFEDQTTVKNLLRNIENTLEWHQFNKMYYDAYKNDVKDEAELDEFVRREVLGKILSKAFLNEFLVQEDQVADEVQVNLFAKLKEIFDRFIERVSAYFKVGKHTEELDTFTKQVLKMFNEGTLADNLNMYQTEDVKFRFYSFGGNNELSKVLVQGIRVLENQISVLLKGGKGLNVDKTKLKALNRDLEADLTLQAAVGVIDLTNSHVNYLKKALETAKDNFLTVEEDNVYYSLVHRMLPILNAMKGRIVENATSLDIARKSEWNEVLGQLNDLVVSITDVQASISVQKNGAIERWADTMIDRHQFPPEYKEEVMKYASVMEKDTNSFFLYIGQLMHSHDPLLNLFGTMTSDTIKQANMKFVRRSKEFMLKLDTLGISPKELNKLYDRGYLLDEVDHYAFNEKKNEIEVEEYKRLTGDSRTVQEILTEKNKKGELELFEKLTVEQKTEHQRSVRNRLRELTESPFAEQYYKEVQEKYTTLGISNVTIAFLGNLSADRGALTRKVTDPTTKTVDYSQLTEYELYQLALLQKERANSKSLFDLEGRLKSGILVSKEQTEGLTSVFVNGRMYELGVDVSTEARIAFDLNKLDNQYSDPNNGKIARRGITKLFKDTLKKSKDKKAFIKANSIMMLSDDVWDSLVDANSIEDRLIAVGMVGYADALNMLKTSLKAILRTSPTLNRPSEIDADGLSARSRREIKDLQQSINDLISKVYQDLLSAEKESNIKYEEETEQERLIVKKPNQSYYQYIKDNNLEEGNNKEFIDFLLNNMTDRDKSFATELFYSLDDLALGYSRGITKAQRKIIQNYIGEEGLDNIDDQLETIIEDVFIPYAKTKLLPYYTRFVTEQYDKVMNDFENAPSFDYEGFINSVENGEYNEISLVPNFSYDTETDGNMINLGYNPDYEGGFLQPKKPIFENKEYLAKFRPDKEGKATINTALWNALQALKQFHRESLEDLDEYGKHNLFRAPQISKNSLDKAVNLVKGVSMKKVSEIIKDFSLYRVDDLQRGEQIANGVNSLNQTKLIPKYYLRDLENQDDISDELLYSYMLFGQQSNLYEARKTNIGDALALRDTLMNRESGNGKDVKLSNTLKMFESYLDYNFYGIKENGTFEMNILGRKVDLTKLVRKLGSWIQLRNLGLNPIIAATSAITAEVNFSFLEKRIGEHVNIQSSSLANKEFRRLGGDVMTEIGKYSSKSRLNTIFENIGIYDISDRFQNSGYGYGLRNMHRVVMGVHQAANFPIIPRVGLSVLYDYRVVDNNIVNFNQFSKAQLILNSKQTAKNIEAKWKNYEEKAFYNYIKTENGIFSLDLDKFSKDITDKGTAEELGVYVNNKYYGIVDQIKNVVKNVDGSLSTEEKSLMHRHFLMSYFTTHRNWLVTALQRRFKSRHFSTATGELEEGHYVTPYRMLGEVFQETKSMNPFKLAKAMYGKYKEGTLEERRNIHRTGLDYMILTSLALLGYLLAGMADDDDKEDMVALQMANYLLSRTINETASIQGYGLASEFLSVAKSPFVGWQVVQDLYASPGLIFSSTVIKQGRYHGLTEAERQLIKVIPGVKPVYDMMNPYDAYSVYKYNNGSNLSPMLVMLLKGMEEDK